MGLILCPDDLLSILFVDANVALALFNLLLDLLLPVIVLLQALIEDVGGLLVAILEGSNEQVQLALCVLGLEVDPQPSLTHLNHWELDPVHVATLVQHESGCQSTDLFISH